MHLQELDADNNVRENGIHVHSFFNHEMLSEEGIEYFNHTLFSKDGSKVFWLARATPQRNTTSFTVNKDGTNLQRCFPEGWGGSHFD